MKKPLFSQLQSSNQRNAEYTKRVVDQEYLRSQMSQYYQDHSDKVEQLFKNQAYLLKTFE
jgi:hypothetical protein